MKTVVMVIVMVLAAGIAAVFMWNAGDKKATSPATNVGPIVPAEDLASLKARAESGDPEAAYQLGRSLVKGEHGLPNYSEAARLFQAAVAKGHLEAMVSLAELYTVGQGVTNNPAEGLRLYLAAAREGNVKAIYNLAGLYEEGRGVKKDQALAAKWHQLAAERGAAVAQFNLGQRYELGMGVKPDPVEAFKWLRLAARNGIADADEMIERLRSKMTKEQIVEGTRRSESFVLVTTKPSLPNDYSP